MTFAELFNEYYYSHSIPHKKTSLDDLQKYSRHLTSNRHGINLANLKLSSITRAEIARIHAAFGRKHPTQANRLLALISSVFSKGIEWGFVAANNPCKGVRKFREVARDRFLQADALPRLFKALCVESNETVRDFIYVCLLTGARKGNVMAMQWEDLNFDLAEWRIAETKNGTPQSIPLTTEAIALLTVRRQNIGIALSFVFPVSSKSGHIVEPRKIWQRIISRATAIGLINKIAEQNGWSADKIQSTKESRMTLPDHGIADLSLLAKKRGIEMKPLDMRGVRMHDLRRTMGSWQACTGASLPIIGRSLNHKSPQSTAIYARLALDPVRQSMQEATTAMFGTTQRR